MSRDYLARTVDSREVLMTELCTIDLRIMDDFALEPMTRDESRDIYQLFVERTGKVATIITSNRDTADWLNSRRRPTSSSDSCG